MTTVTETADLTRSCPGNVPRNETHTSNNMRIKISLYKNRGFAFSLARYKKMCKVLTSYDNTQQTEVREYEKQQHVQTCKRGGANTTLPVFLRLCFRRL